MKWLKIAGLVVFISIIIGIVALVTLPYRMAREIDARIADIKAQGDPVSGKDLIPHVPDSENGAVIYERVFKIIEPGKKDIVKACDILLSPKSRKDPKQMALAKKIAAKYRSALPLIEQAVTRPHCRFNTNWNDPPEKIVYPYFQKVRNVSRLLAQIAVIDAADGRMDDSMKSIGLNYAVSESIRNEPTMIGFLVRIACISIASGSLKRAAQYGDIPEPQVHKLYDLLGEIDLQSGYMDVIKGERAYGLDIMERVRHGVMSMDSLQVLGSGDSQTKPVAASHLVTGLGAWVLAVRSGADELFFIRYMDRVVDASGKSYHDKAARQAELEPKFPKYAVASVIVMPVFAQSKQILYESMATLAGDRVFLAVLAYKSKFGGYPASLDDVEKKLGWKLPVDPMTDESFRYRREGKGFIVYGLGKNMKDDNAETKPKDAKDVGRSGEYSYSNGDGRYSADMIWQKSK